jgi:hypothetical protein
MWKQKKEGEREQHSYDNVGFRLLTRSVMLDRFFKITEPAATATADMTIMRLMFKLSGIADEEYGMSPQPDGTLALLVGGQA